MAKSTPSGKYEPVVEWAFANWSPAPTLSFRIGRVGAPLFLVSASREVGYTSLQVPVAGPPAWAMRRARSASTAP
ncbi:MAG: hypothetical protein ACK4K3_01405 [Aquabacterium sp.]